MDTLIKDLRFSLRTLARRPGFTALALLTIGLGIGANTAIFSVVNAVLLRPLAYPDPDRLVAVYEQELNRGWERAPASAQDFLAWRDEVRGLSAMAAMSGGSFSLTGDGDPERVTGNQVTAEFFTVLGTAPALGTPFTADANVDGAHRTVVLSHRLWERRYGADPSLVGRSVEIDGEPYEVAAVMPPDFRFPTNAELWLPLVIREEQLQDLNWHFLFVTGRLAEGTSLEEARSELKALAARRSQEFPESNGTWGVELFPLHGEMVQQSRTMLLVLLGAVAFVLLIACANAANLLLVRSAGRVREMSVRAAIGAGKTRLVRQLLTESVLLGMLGGLLGLALGAVGVEALVALSPITVPGGAAVGLDGSVLAFTAAAAVLTGALFGLAPAAAVWRADLNAGLRDGGRAGTAGSGGRLRAGLVVAEMALALVLVTGAGLMLQSMAGLQGVDVGVRTDNLLIARIALPEARYETAEERVSFFDQLLDRVEAVPGVRSAAISPFVPPASGPQYHVRVEGVHTDWVSDLPVARFRTVSPRYFETLDIPLVRGRTFTDQDAADAPMVAVIDEAMAEFLFPGQDPIGQQIRTYLDVPREIVGVVGNVNNTGLGNEAQPTDYVPYAQTPLPSQALIVHTAGDPLGLSRAVQAAIWEMDDKLPVFSVESMEDRLATSLAAPRFNTTLMGLFAVLALVLAGVGIYGVMAHNVSERTREIGLRMALGATGRSVVGLVVRNALGLAALGVVVGLGASVALTRVVEGFLYGIRPNDPLTLAAVAGILALVAFAASWLPAVRASRLDPLVALRED